MDLLDDNVECIDQIFDREDPEALKETLSNPEGRKQLQDFLSKGKTSKLFEVKADAFAKTIIESMDPHIWKINSKKDLVEENLLHFLINQKFFASIRALLSIDDPHVNELIFERNKAGNTPLMYSLTQMSEKLADTDKKMEGVRHKIWSITKRPENFERITEASEFLNHRKMSLLHLCAQNGENKVLLAILKLLKDIEQQRDVHKIQKVIFHQSGEEKTILDMCRDEGTVIQILDMLIFPAAEELNFTSDL